MLSILVALSPYLNNVIASQQFSEALTFRDPTIVIDDHGVRIIEVDQDHCGRRLDNFLFHLMTGVPKSRVYRMIRSGEVRINGRRVKQGQRIKTGDNVRIPPVRSGNSSSMERSVSKQAKNQVLKSILYEDDELLVLDKPAGIPVHSGTSYDYGVIEILRLARSSQSTLDLVHRLDRDTSGCLMIAKRPPTLRSLHAMMRDSDIEKRYLALVAGDWAGDGRLIDEPLKRSSPRGRDKVMDVNSGGKRARTWMEPVERFGAATLIKAHLHTGRTHQIRVHAAHVAHPIAGDQKYGDTGFNQQMHALGLRRLFLHASEIGFRRPGSDRLFRIQAPLPDPLTSVLARLRGMDKTTTD